MRNAPTSIVLGMTLAALAGCDGSTAAAKRPAESPLHAAFKSHWEKGGERDGTPSQDAPAGGGADASIETPALHVSDAIARACHLEHPHTQASFDFDSTVLAEADRAMLASVARCLAEGPLRGKGLMLVGRADARGENEYNMSLGEVRADSVRKYLHDLGVEMDRVSASSRGELDANGRDEAGYAEDRRVDIDVTN